MWHLPLPPDTVERWAQPPVGVPGVLLGLGLPGILLSILWSEKMKIYTDQEVAASIGEQWYRAQDVAGLVKQFYEVLEKQREIDVLLRRMNTPIWLEPAAVVKAPW